MTARVKRLSSLFYAVTILTSACSVSREPGLSDRDGGGYDAGPIPGVDSDGDALCDITEAGIGSDPNDVDSDDDSFPDDVEWRANYDATAPAEPARDHVIYIRETATEPLSTTIVVPVRGAGQVFQGYVSASGSLRESELIVTDFLAQGFALDAYPRANVLNIDSEAARFIGVEGRTQLVFSIAFQNGTNPLRDCIRAFPFRFNVKTDVGNIVWSDAYLLVVVPDPASAHASEWCSPVASCT